MLAMLCFCKSKKSILLFDGGRNKQLFALHHILQLTQIAHIVDFPTKLKTVQEHRDDQTVNDVQ